MRTNNILHNISFY